MGVYEDPNICKAAVNLDGEVNIEKQQLYIPFWLPANLWPQSSDCYYHQLSLHEPGKGLVNDSQKTRRLKIQLVPVISGRRGRCFSCF